MRKQVLDVRNLSAGYGSHRVVSEINLQLDLGEWFSLMGPNASGKSTLLSCLTGQLAPLAGSVSICGHDLAREAHRAKAQSGFAHPPAALPGLLTGWQCLEVYAAAKNLAGFDADMIELARAFQLMELLPRFVDTYSLGTRQKLSALLALLGEPQLVILDEVFNGLDPKSVLLLKGYLRTRVDQNACSVLLATHSLDMVLEHSTRAGLLLDGKLHREVSVEELIRFRGSGLRAFERAMAGHDVAPRQ